MPSAADFWKHQPFAYLVTYSFNRGALLAVPDETITALIARQQALPSNDYLQQYKLKRQLRELKQENDLATYRRRITNGKGEFDRTAEQIAVIERDSANAEQLNKVFQKVSGEVMYAMCLPVFRDAFAFYDEQGRLLRTLNICFECLYMELNNQIPLEADVAAYKALQDMLIRLGHPIESGGW